MTKKFVPTGLQPPLAPVYEIPDLAHRIAHALHGTSLSAAAGWDDIAVQCMLSGTRFSVKVSQPRERSKEEAGAVALRRLMDQLAVDRYKVALFNRSTSAWELSPPRAAWRECAATAIGIAVGTIAIYREEGTEPVAYVPFNISHTPVFTYDPMSIRDLTIIAALNDAEVAPMRSGPLPSTDREKAIEVIIAAARKLVADADALRGGAPPQEEDYTDTESAYANGEDVGVWRAAERFRAALADLADFRPALAGGPG